jgi:hypothetical protein
MPIVVLLLSALFAGLDDEDMLDLTQMNRAAMAKTAGWSVAIETAFTQQRLLAGTFPGMSGTFLATRLQADALHRISACVSL